LTTILKASCFKLTVTVTKIPDRELPSNQMKDKKKKKKKKKKKA
jgi:hypothetical protein